MKTSKMVDYLEKFQSSFFLMRAVLKASSIDWLLILYISSLASSPLITYL